MRRLSCLFHVKWILLFCACILFWSPSLSFRCCSVCALPPTNLSRRLGLLSVMLSFHCVFCFVVLFPFFLAVLLPWLSPSGCACVLTSHEPSKATGNCFSLFVWLLNGTWNPQSWFELQSYRDYFHQCIRNHKDWNWRSEGVCCLCVECFCLVFGYVTWSVFFVLS